MEQTSLGGEVSHWQAALALLGVGVLYLLLPSRLRLGPPWLILLLVLLLLVPLNLARIQGHHGVSHWLSRTATTLVTVAVALSVVFLAIRVPAGKTAGSTLLQDSALLWSGNILVFALWYWEIDGGGPHHRRFGHYQSTDVAFPQFQQDPLHASEYWMPDFLDYLFLAFNTSTAFSPTDTVVLSRRAKLLMMSQSLISLVAISVLIARAINTI